MGTLLDALLGCAIAVPVILAVVWAQGRIGTRRDCRRSVAEFDRRVGMMVYFDQPGTGKRMCRPTWVGTPRQNARLVADYNGYIGVHDRGRADV